MKELTKKRIVAICDNVIKKLNEAKQRNEMLFLCNTIKKEISAIEYKELYEINIESIIPEFTKINAVIMANAIEEWTGGVWWCGTKTNFDYDNRIEFMNFIKECYENK